MMSTTRSMVLLLLGLLAFDQSSYGQSLPFPRRSSKNKPNMEDLEILKGSVRKISAEEVVLESDDKRLYKVIRNDKTKFLEKEEPVKPETIEPGDRLMIDAAQDSTGHYTAVEVRVTKRGSPEDHARAKSPLPSSDDFGTPPTANPTTDQGKTKEQAKTQQAAATLPEPVERPATEMAPPAPKTVPGQEDRPKLARGKAAPRKAAADDDDLKDDGKPIQPRSVDGIAAQRAEEMERLRRADGPPSADVDAKDAFIEQARETALNFVETLPSYTVKQFTTRFQSDNPRVNWQPLDNVSAEVVYENGKENYKNILVNGKPPKGKIEDSGSWSTGEFGTVLLDIFSPASAADFRPSGTSTIVNRTAKIYKFVVEQPNSHWHIVAPGPGLFPVVQGHDVDRQRDVSRAAYGDANAQYAQGIPVRHGGVDSRLRLHPAWRNEGLSAAGPCRESCLRARYKHLLEET